MHDVGMLSSPSESDLFNNDSKRVLRNYYFEELDSISQIAVSEIDNNIQLKKVLDIHSIIAKYRESIVRDNHGYVSEKEMVTDYPKLPLEVAERRDIGVISTSHNPRRKDSERLDKKISDDIYDGPHPIRLRLLSNLLKVADCCDVTKSRISRDVLERNITIMDEVSIFHWIKHMSVDEVGITQRENTKNKKVRIIHIQIIHNYLPALNVNEDVLTKVCGEKCKKKCSDYGLDKLVDSMGIIEEKDGVIRFLDKKECSFTCLFINKAYAWFYAEVIRLNKYFKEKKMDVEIDLSVNYTENPLNDFEVVKNREFAKGAQQFMISFLLR